MKLSNFKTKDLLLIIVFALILASPFVKLPIFSNEYVKVLFLLVIVVITFYDLKLAILITVLFLILVINSPTKKERYISISTSDNNIVKLVDIAASPSSPATCPGAPNAGQDQINDHMFGLFFDPKIKPFKNKAV